MSDHAPYEILLVKATDGLLSREERDTLDAHLKTCSRCRDELADFQGIKKTTDAMTARIRADALIEAPRERRPARMVLGIGVLLLVIGAAILLAFAAYSFFADTTVPLVVKAGAGALGLGLLILSAYVVTIRVRASRRDPYQEIDR